MLNSQIYTLNVCKHNALHVQKSVTGPLSCLLEEAEDFGKFSNPGYLYYLWDDFSPIGEHHLFHTYTDLLQYLRKEVA